MRGDCNSSKTNSRRNKLFSNFCDELGLQRVPLHHHTYHHFLGDGASDSELDVILFPSTKDVHEELVKIACKHTDHKVDSHHDLLLTACSVPATPCQPLDQAKNLKAPRLVNDKHRIIWSEDTLPMYQGVLSSYLPHVRRQWLDPSSETSMSILLEVTNMILSESALMFNKSIQLATSTIPKSAKVPLAIKRSNNKLASIARKMRQQSQDRRFSPCILLQTRAKYKKVKSEHRRLVRRQRMVECNQRDSELFSIFSNSNRTYQRIRLTRKTSSIPIKKLHVRDKVYEGDNVCDGFYDSIAYLKTEAHENLPDSETFASADEEYKNIVRICKEGIKVPPISLQQTKSILSSLRPNVCDYSSITANHYLHSGNPGLVHLQELINALIADMNNLKVPELNTASACILHKAHGKNRMFADSYRTISSCAFTSRVLDSYISHLYSHLWERQEATTQFQGNGSNHRLAALLLTKTIQHSLHTSKRPVYVL